MRNKFANLPYGKISEYGHTSNQIFASFLRNSERFRGSRSLSQQKTTKKSLDALSKNTMSQRLLIAADKLIRKKEKKWNNRFAFPTSEYNQAVFKKYRYLFENK